jgi:short-subunit dehydrogenase
LVTGGSSGIGFAIAEHLVRTGTHVTLAARDKQRLETAAERLRKSAAGHVRIDFFPLDVTDREAVRESVSLVSSIQPPDLIINAAGYVLPGYVEQLEFSTFETTMDINAGGIWNIVKAYTPMMPEGGTVVNISSFSGLLGTFGYTAYAASKYAVIGLSEALRNELSLRKIQVSVLCPPDTDTPQLEQENRFKPPETKALSEHAGLLQPDFVARALFRGLKKGHFIIIPGIRGKLIYLLKRLCPGIIYRSIDRTIIKVRNQQ